MRHCAIQSFYCPTRHMRKKNIHYVFADKKTCKTGAGLNKRTSPIVPADSTGEFQASCLKCFQNITLTDLVHVRLYLEFCTVSIRQKKSNWLV